MGIGLKLLYSADNFWFEMTQNWSKNLDACQNLSGGADSGQCPRTRTRENVPGLGLETMSLLIVSGRVPKLACPWIQDNVLRVNVLGFLTCPKTGHVSQGHYTTLYHYVKLYIHLVEASASP